MKIGRVLTQDGAKYCEIGEDDVAIIDGDIFSEHHDVGPRRLRKGVELLMPIQPSKLLVVLGAFPGARTLDAPETEICLGVEDSPKPPPERITLSLQMLRVARCCVLLATGAAKADAVDAMLGEPSRHVPASLLLRERLTVIADDPASPAPAKG